jgi:hypothetical protein
LDHLTVTVGPFSFIGKLELENAPKTCAKILEWLPLENQVIQARWSGEAVWVPLDGVETGLDFENHTCHPSRGDILIYPGGYTDAEILIPYGNAHFGSKMGELAGNHFLTIVSGQEHLAAMGRKVLWEGAQPISFTLA